MDCYLVGLGIGTASNRLRKAVMLKLLQKLDEDWCFRCGARIETPDDLSLDHIEPWLHDDPEKFWNVENVAFSHYKCNTTNRRNRKRNPKCGTLWAYQLGCRCSSCKAVKAIDNKKTRQIG